MFSKPQYVVSVCTIVINYSGGRVCFVPRARHQTQAGGSYRVISSRGYVDFLVQQKRMCQVHLCFQTPRKVARERGGGCERGWLEKQGHLVGAATYQQQGLFKSLCYFFA